MRNATTVDDVEMMLDAIGAYARNQRGPSIDDQVQAWHPQEGEGRYHVVDVMVVGADHTRVFLGQKVRDDGLRGPVRFLHRIDGPVLNPNVLHRPLTAAEARLDVEIGGVFRFSLVVADGHLSPEQLHQMVRELAGPLETAAGEDLALDAGGVTHRCPHEGSGVTPCCGHTPFELPPADRITVLDALVDCPGPQ